MTVRYQANLELLPSSSTSITRDHLSQLAGRLIAIPGKQPWLLAADRTKGPQIGRGSQPTQETFNVLEYRTRSSFSFSLLPKDGRPLNIKPIWASFPRCRKKNSTQGSNCDETFFFILFIIVVGSSFFQFIVETQKSQMTQPRSFKVNSRFQVSGLLVYCCSQI